MRRRMQRVRAFEPESLRGEAIAACALHQTPRDAADRGNADRGAVVDLSIGQAIEQQRHDAPAVRHRFELGRRAQIGQQGAQLAAIVQPQQRVAQRVERVDGRGVRLEGTAFHADNVIERYYISQGHRNGRYCRVTGRRRGSPPGSRPFTNVIQM